jgi:hypothetical protein
MQLQPMWLPGVWMSSGSLAINDKEGLQRMRMRVGPDGMHSVHCTRAACCRLYRPQGWTDSHNGKQTNHSCTELSWQLGNIPTQALKGSASHHLWNPVAACTPLYWPMCAAWSYAGG